MSLLDHPGIKEAVRHAERLFLGVMLVDFESAWPQLCSAEVEAIRPWHFAVPLHRAAFVFLRLGGESPSTLVEHLRDTNKCSFAAAVALVDECLDTLPDDPAWLDACSAESAAALRCADQERRREGLNATLTDLIPATPPESPQSLS